MQALATRRASAEELTEIRKLIDQVTATEETSEWEVRDDRD